MVKKRHRESEEQRLARSAKELRKRANAQNLSEDAIDAMVKRSIDTQGA